MNSLNKLFIHSCLILFLFFNLTLLENQNNADITENDFSEFDDFEEQDIEYQNLEDPVEIKNDIEIEQIESVISSNEEKISNTDNLVSSEKLNDEIEQNNDQLEKNDVEKIFKPLSISNFPLHLRNNFTSYYVEILIIFIIITYFINFLIGSTKNSELTKKFWTSNHELLKSNFLIVENSENQEIKNEILRETDIFYYIWCTGKVGLECFLIELNFCNRQDLISKITNLFLSISDQFTIKVFLNDDSMDSFVFCLANKKTGLKVVENYNDVFNFCSKKKTVEKLGFLNEYFVVLSEIGDVVNLILDNYVIDFLAKNYKSINYIHISDQFSGPKPSSYKEPTKPPINKKVLTFCFDLPSESDMEDTKNLINFALYLTNRMLRFKLKKDLKLKADKNRLKVEKHYRKIEHDQRQEAVQAKKEEKRRLEKEKIINENNSYKLRKLEEKERRKEMKKKALKMKQVKVKAM